MENDSKNTYILSTYFIFRQTELLVLDSGKKKKKIKFSSSGRVCFAFITFNLAGQDFQGQKRAYLAYKDLQMRSIRYHNEAKIFGFKLFSASPCNRAYRPERFILGVVTLLLHARPRAVTVGFAIFAGPYVDPARFEKVD